MRRILPAKADLGECPCCRQSGAIPLPGRLRYICAECERPVKTPCPRMRLWQYAGWRKYVFARYKDAMKTPARGIRVSDPSAPQ